MIHKEDKQNLQRMLKQEDLPAELINEAELRTQLFQRTGMTGPIGVAECANMIRFLGLGKIDEIRNAPLETYDFRKIPLNSDLWVKQEDGYYRKATYLGGAVGGKIAVRYVGSKETCSAKPCNCLKHEPPVQQIEPVVVDSPEPVQEVEVTVATKKGKKLETAAA